MTSIEVYNDLIKQYEQLSLEEKNAILIYKSQLYNIINAMSAIPNFLNMNEEELLNQLDRDYLINKNITTRYTIFFHIDFTNILTCMKSLKEVYKTIMQAKGKIKLKDKLTVYRGVNLDVPDSPTNLSRGEIISTGLKLDDAFTFLLHKKYNHLYVIEIEAGTSVLVTPYALIITYPANENHILNQLNNIEPDVLKVMRLGSRVQEEVILFQSDLTLDETTSTIKYLEDDNTPINVHFISAYHKEIENEVIK